MEVFSDMLLLKRLMFLVLEELIVVSRETCDE